MAANVITISGELGSGKSTVASRLAGRLNFQKISMGDLQRAVAEQLGITILELNLRAEQDPQIDQTVDARFKHLAETGKPYVIDSRVAWAFMPDSYKVRLIASPIVAANRLFGRQTSAEEYKSAEQAFKSAEQRTSAEQGRFLRRYGIDISRLRNYDLVVDTTAATPEQVVETILRYYNSSVSTPVLQLEPHQITPTEDVARRLARNPHREPSSPNELREILSADPISVGRASGKFFVVDGHRRLSAAIIAKLPLVPAVLLAEDHEMVIADIPAIDYLKNEAKLSFIYDWEDGHGFRMESYPVLSDS